MISSASSPAPDTVAPQQPQEFKAGDRVLVRRQWAGVIGHAAGRKRAQLRRPATVIFAQTRNGYRNYTIEFDRAPRERLLTRIDVGAHCLEKLTDPSKESS